jgi:hypothetical protein
MVMNIWSNRRLNIAKIGYRLRQSGLLEPSPVPRAAAVFVCLGWFS